MPMHLGYLACRDTLPGSPTRRPDAFEHDQTMQNLVPAFESNGGRVTAVSWDDPHVDWSGFDAVLIGTAWDYQDRLDEFLGALAAIEDRTRLFNSPATVRWNAHKSYLRDLARRGVRTIPTEWIDDATAAAVRGAFDRLDSNDLVIKRQVGACAEGQYRLKRSDAIPPMPHPMMIQPFLPAIVSEGEISVVFVGGEISHALLKTAATGDYRIQSCYGGKEAAIELSCHDAVAARRVIDALDETPLYARVDLLRADDGGLLLMELELIEPFLYPLQGPELGMRIRDVLARMLST